jgi:hypothetical protein
MTTRTTHATILFRHPFSLGSIEGELPAGTYLIETEEEELGTLSLAAYRRTATTIVLPSLGSISRMRQVITIDPFDLAGAKMRDEKRGDASPFIAAENSTRV